MNGKGGRREKSDAGPLGLLLGSALCRSYRGGGVGFLHGTTRFQTLGPLCALVMGDFKRPDRPFVDHIVSLERLDFFGAIFTWFASQFLLGAFWVAVVEYFYICGFF